MGQGDAILVSYGYWQMLIDGGKDRRVLACLNRNLPFGDRTLEFVVATHADSDHVGGLALVLKTFRVQRLITTYQLRETDDFKQFWRLVQVKKSKGTRLTHSCGLESLWFDSRLSVKAWSTSGSGCLFNSSKPAKTESILWDKNNYFSKSDDNYNNGSIIIFIQFEHHSFLFTGDLEKEGELALINSGLLRKTNVLKVGHHGSKSSTSELFLATVRPEISLISVGKGNPYHHPSPLVIKRLLEVGSLIYRTDQEGEIKLISDGEALKVLRSR